MARRVHLLSCLLLQVRWTPTNTIFEKRLSRYERFPLNPVHLEVCNAWTDWCWHQQTTQQPLLLLLPQIHWFSIINSCVTVLLLTGFLATILMRVLKADFSACAVQHIHTFAAH